MSKLDLEREMRTFGQFGAVCCKLARLRSLVRSDDPWTDNEIAERFEVLASPYRRCFNKQAFIAACREPD